MQIKSVSLAILFFSFIRIWLVRYTQVQCPEVFLFFVFLAWFKKGIRVSVIRRWNDAVIERLHYANEESFSICFKIC